MPAIQRLINTQASTETALTGVCVCVSEWVWMYIHMQAIWIDEKCVSVCLSTHIYIVAQHSCWHYLKHAQNRYRQKKNNIFFSTFILTVPDCMCKNLLSDPNLSHIWTQRNAHVQYIYWLLTCTCGFALCILLFAFVNDLWKCEGRSWPRL